MPWKPNESSSIIGKHTCVYDQGRVSSKLGGRHTDRFLPTFLFLDFMITTQNICHSPWSNKLNPRKIPSLCIVIFTFWNYLNLIAFKGTRPLMTLWKFLILSIKYFQFMLKNDNFWVVFLPVVIGLAEIAEMPFPDMDFLFTSWSVVSHFLFCKVAFSTN